MSVPIKSLLRLPGVQEIVPLSRSEIYRRLALGTFPKPIKIGERAVAWDADEIQEYVRKKLGMLVNGIDSGDAAAAAVELEPIGGPRT
jgi:prophage regulatory protein